MIPAVRAILENPLTEPQIHARLRHVPHRGLLRSLREAFHAGLVHGHNWTAASIALAFAIQRGGSSAEVAALASLASLDPWSRAAAACALLARQRLSEHHGAAVLEALVFGLLASDQPEAASRAATALAATGVSAEVIRRVDGWRALAGVDRSFWAEAERWMTVRDATGLDQELQIRTWVTPPNGLGGFTVLVDIGLRDGPPEVRGSAFVAVREGTARAHRHRLTGPLAEAIAEQESIGAIEAPAGEVAALVREVTGEAIAPLERFETDPAAIEPGPVTLDEAIALLQRPLTGATWFLDAIDTKGTPPEDGDAALLAITDRSEVRDRCIQATCSLSRWYAWKGDMDAARALAGLAIEGDDWRGSLLGKALVRMSSRSLPLPAARAPGAPAELRFGRVSEDGRDAYFDAFCAALHDYPGPNARSSGSRLGWGATVVLFSLDLYGVSPFGWSPAFLKNHVLLDALPRHSITLPEDAPGIVADMRAMIRHFRERWGLEQADDLLRALDGRLEARLTAALGDESLWTGPKAAMIRARRAGVDTNDLDAIVAFFEQGAPRRRAGVGYS